MGQSSINSADSSRSFMQAIRDVTSSQEQSIWWLFRIFVFWEFLGHGAFGIITKSGWLPYFAVYGIPENAAWTLMPIVGSMDILLGLTALFAPRRGFILYMAIWGLMTALLRPFSGEPWSEFFERAYNYGVPFAMFLTMTWSNKNAGWFQKISDAPKLTQEQWKFLKVFFQITISFYMIGHGLFGVLDGKTGLITQYNTLGIASMFDGVETSLLLLGGAEIVLGLLVLFVPLTPILVTISAWKIGTELFFPMSGAFYGWFEFIERGASYAAPIILLLIISIINRKTKAN